MENLFERIMGIYPQTRETNEPNLLQPRIRHDILGDDVISLEQITLENKKPAIKIQFPKSQFVTIPYGTKNQKVKYNSPEDDDERIVNVTYFDNNCTIEMPEDNLSLSINL